MRFEEISFKIHSEMPLLTISEKFQGTTISKWSLWNRDLIHLPFQKNEAFQTIVDFYGAKGAVLESIIDRREGNTLIIKCMCEADHDLEIPMGENNLMTLSPTIFLNGWAYYRAISFEPDGLRKLFSEIKTRGRVEMQSKKNVDMDTRPHGKRIGTLLKQLTGKQIDALTGAYDNGYYAFPRGVSTESIATSMGISRPTYEEHLRKAENKVMDSVVPQLKLFRAGNSVETDPPQGQNSEP